jgi:hypothetical protein
MFAFLLLLLFAAYRYMTTGGILLPKMRGRLDVIKPTHLEGTSIRLVGLSRLELGSGTMQLSEMPASIELFAHRRRGRNTTVRMGVTTGNVLVKSLGEPFATSISATVDLKPDDQIMVDEFVIVYATS